MVNAYYVRAAIEAATGIRLTINKTVDYLLSEGMITEAEAAYERMDPYAPFYDRDYTGPRAERDVEMGLPDEELPEQL